MHALIVTKCRVGVAVGKWADSYHYVHRMATNSLSDEELRRRLEKLGVHPGPITDTTRALYFSKLEQETKKNGSKRKHPPSSSDHGINVPAARGPLATSHPRPQDAVGVLQSNGVSFAQPVTPPPAPVTVQAPQTKAIPSPQSAAPTSSRHCTTRAQGCANYCSLLMLICCH